MRKKGRIALAFAVVLTAALGATLAYAARTATPNPVDFGTLDQSTGEQIRKDVTYSITAGEDLDVIPSIVNDDSGGNLQWQVGLGTCPSTFPSAPASCQLDVRLDNASQAIGVFNATLRISNGSSNLDVPMRVRYVDPPKPGGPKGDGKGPKKAKKCKKKAKKGAAAAKKKCKKKGK